MRFIQKQHMVYGQIETTNLTNELKNELETAISGPFERMVNEEYLWVFKKFEQGDIVRYSNIPSEIILNIPSHDQQVIDIFFGECERELGTMNSLEMREDELKVLS